ncbi:PDR/VanB family oxidoreductase [Nocardia jiangxiensis]|uniref:PDR/VanB family oxidoreductase n=1 Tax=Nocardia jiangxiensis TaxID=282685 RepID=A0ABW6SC51_9NOCA
MTQTGPGGLAVRDDVFGDAPTTTLRIRQVRWEADDIISIELVAPEGDLLPEWEPGAHVDVFLDSGLIRQYSLCGDAGDRSYYRIAVLREREGRGGSAEIHRDVRAGGTMRIGKPRNLFRVPDAVGYLCVAGGVGVTPILSIVRDAHNRNIPVRLVYGGRSSSSMSFVEELQALLPSSAVGLVPQDQRGMIDLEHEIRALPAGWVVCACGPSGMLAALEGVCEQRRVRDRLVVERFSASDSVAAQLAGAENRAVTVHLEQSGTTVVVAPDESILDTVENMSPVLSSCREGYCGTCETRVIRGIPEHRDTVLTEEERESNEIMMICVSRAVGDELTLDL